MESRNVQGEASVFGENGQVTLFQALCPISVEPFATHVDCNHPSDGSSICAVAGKKVPSDNNKNDSVRAYQFVTIFEWDDVVCGRCNAVNLTD